MTTAKRSRSTTTLVVELPMPDNIANGRMHWRVKLNAKKAYFATCDAWQSLGETIAPPKKPLQRPTIASVMRLGARMDQDNAMARHKWALDWLQTRGYIVNDRHLTWLTLPTQIVGRRDDYTLELTLTEIENV